jgi:hypothetical protein
METDNGWTNILIASDHAALFIILGVAHAIELVVFVSSVTAFFLLLPLCGFAFALGANRRHGGSGT